VSYTSGREKYLYSTLYYISVVGDCVVYFSDIRPTEHYLENHSHDVSWDKVVEIIFTTKNPRKKGNNFEIETDKYYLLFEIKDDVLYVINAKVRK